MDRASDDLPTMSAAITPSASASAPPELPRDLLAVDGGFRLQRQLGSGGYGEVWRAEAPGGIEVAIKRVFRPLNHDSAQRELQALDAIKGLRHPFLLSTQMYYALEDRLLIVMELADGSLRDRVRECKKNGLPALPVSELMGYLHESAEGLDFLHERRVVHRDVKPENILLLQRHAKLGDFGMARLMEDNRGGIGIASGTPAYMAPEVWGGAAVAASDQYALALSYAEIRVDRRIFVGDTATELMAAHIERSPDLRPLPDAEQQVLLKALAKDPTRRYRSCREFVRELENALFGPPRVEPASGPLVLRTASLEREIPPPSADHLRFAERPIDAERSLRFCGTLLGVLSGLCLWALVNHVNIGVVHGSPFSDLSRRLYPLLLGIVGGVIGVLIAMARSRPGPVTLLALLGAGIGIMADAAVAGRWDAPELCFVLRYPSAFAAKSQGYTSLVVGGLLGALGGALLAVGVRIFGERLRRLLIGALAGALVAALLGARWVGGGVAFASGAGPVVWSENLLAIPALHVGAGVVMGVFLADLLPRVGQRPS